MSFNWGNYPAHDKQLMQSLYWRDEDPFDDTTVSSFLPHGNGRSYGDSCLNTQGLLVDTLALRRFLAFDPLTGVLRCESGVLLSDILDVVVPKGWILPVLPGTKFVSVGGAIANDVHGKNHHQTGTFGCHVAQFELLRSSGERVICSLQTNEALFRATIGGLGLTGIILWVELQLQPLSSTFLAVETTPFCGLEAFYHLAKQAEHTAAYSVAWLDCLAKGRHFARGLFMTATVLPSSTIRGKPAMSFKKMPCYAPAFVVNRGSMSLFNAWYYRKGARQRSTVTYYDDYFFPLDRILDWNKIYGKRGFLQYQCVLPWSGCDGLVLMLREIAQSGLGSCLSVLKTFGERQSPGLLSFPMPGVTLALDFPNRRPVFALLERLDEHVMAAGGRVYAAKDARMSARAFQCYYPQSEMFSRWVDPKFSSDFWRRVMGPG